MHAPNTNQHRTVPAPNAPIALSPADTFVDTEHVNRITQRALAYLEADYPLHLAGPAGTGKTTLAFHIAAQRNRPVSLVHGNDAFNGTDLIGADRGYKRSTVVDNYIHSVLKTDESLDVNWVDNRLTLAVREGHTLIYDEFNRTRPEANNILLALLEERILTLPAADHGYLRAHPDFRIILTSNPAEYAGVHRAQDALLDRLITITCEHYDAPTETRIVTAASDMHHDDAHRIVRIVRALRGEHGDRQQPTVRAAIALARVTRHTGAAVSPDDTLFTDMAWDLLADAAQDIAEGEEPVTRDEFRQLIASLIDNDATDAPQPPQRLAA
jgi:gas vesicle protein GvpN